MVRVVDYVVLNPIPFQNGHKNCYLLFLFLYLPTFYIFCNEGTLFPPVFKSRWMLYSFFYQSFSLVRGVVLELWNWDWHQSSGAPNDCFLWNICSEKQKCLEFSIAWGRLKISRWTFHSCTIFEAYLINSLPFLKLNFFHFTPQVKQFFVQKGNLKCLESKMRCREE